MENQRTQNYTGIAIAIVVAAVILGAAIVGSSLSHTTVTSVSTSTATSTEVSIVVSTVISSTSITTTSTATSTSVSTATSTATVTTNPSATSILMVSSVNQNAETISGHYTVLGGPAGSLVVAEGFGPAVVSVAAGQTYSLRAENNGSCTFSEWSDGTTTNPRSFTATGAPASFTAVYSCGSAGPASPIVQSCTGYYPTTGTVGQNTTLTASSTTAATTTTVTEPPNQAVAVACPMSGDVRAGDLIVVKLSDLPGVNFSDSLGNSYKLLETDPASSTYYNFIYYAIASTSGPDTLTVQGYGNYPSIMAVELHGVHTISGYETATGVSGFASVPSFTPSPASFVIAFVEPLGVPIPVSAGAGYALAAVYAVSNACEFGTVTGPTVSSFNLGASTSWEEVSLVFS